MHSGCESTPLGEPSGREGQSSPRGRFGQSHRRSSYVKPVPSPDLRDSVDHRRHCPMRSSAVANSFRCRESPFAGLRCEAL